MIVTVTPNPSLDRTLEVDHLERGAVVRAEATRVEAGGKGINVARALHLNGEAVCAVLPSGGYEGQNLVGLLAGAGIDPAVVAIRGAVRANVSLVEPDGTVTKINEPGPTMTGDEIDALLELSARRAVDASWVVGSGSLPPGAPVTLFADLTERAHRAGSRIAIDTSGPALAAALDAGPDLVKPNLQELEEISGRAILTVGDATEAADELRHRGAGAVLASLGAAGALLVDASGALHAHAAVLQPRSSVGAGDATLAGYLLAGDSDHRQALGMAVAFGAGAVALPGSQMPGPAAIHPELVTVTDRPQHQLVLVPGTPRPSAHPT